MSYHDVAHFVRTWGMIYFVVLFAIVMIYALWPRNRDKFERASRMPLEED